MSNLLQINYPPRFENDVQPGAGFAEAARLNPRAAGYAAGELLCNAALTPGAVDPFNYRVPLARQATNGFRPFMEGFGAAWNAANEQRAAARRGVN